MAGWRALTKTRGACINSDARAWWALLLAGGLAMPVDARPVTPVWQGNGDCRLLIVGDSLAARWSAPAPPGWRQAVAGEAGARASELAAPIGALIASTRPHAILLFAGSNDARAAALWPWGDAAGQAATAIAGIARAGQASGARMVVADLLAPGPQPWWRSLLIGARQGQAMAAITARLTLPASTRRLPVAHLLAGRDGIDPAMRSDHLHYSAAGYARLAAGLVPLLQDACDLDG